MAKKDKGKDKERRARIPKEIAGFRVPKEVRRTGDALIAGIDTPAGRELIATGLTVAAAATAALARQRAARGTPDRPGDAGTRHDTNEVVNALGDAARTMLDRFLGPHPR